MFTLHTHRLIDAFVIFTFPNFTYSLGEENPFGYSGIYAIKILPTLLLLLLDQIT